MQHLACRTGLLLVVGSLIHPDANAARASAASCMQSHTHPGKPQSSRSIAPATHVPTYATRQMHRPTNPTTRHHPHHACHDIHDAADALLRAPTPTASRPPRIPRHTQTTTAPLNRPNHTTSPPSRMP
ncbi:hypothetical protein THER5_1932 [Bifidobacterium thermacidophilum subsp. thermacidophilum]|uniref:Secreted protein n=1 Tax=Bifidobacterium thermacidophilum subsp. thermacidophilum TaxID=79262 RepID=A0A087E3K9_9BIFI|nr:hypothetical protein THER5_1932 [Bifidobacterium thermacidophilum subsp. thermacidophilum]